MNRSAQIGAFFRKGWRRICTGTVRRVKQLEEDIDSLDRKTVCMDGERLSELAICVVMCLLMLLIGIVGVIFPAVLRAIVEALSNSLLLRGLLLILMFLALPYCILFGWSIAGLLTHAGRKHYSAGIMYFRSWCRGDMADRMFAKRFDEPFDEFFDEPFDEPFDEMYGEPPHDPLDETEYDCFCDDDGSEGTDAEEDKIEAESQEQRNGESDEGSGSNERKAPGFIGRIRGECDHEPPHHRRLRARRYAPYNNEPSDDDDSIMVQERVIEGQGRTVLRYTHGYIKRLVARVVSAADERIWLNEIKMNFPKASEEALEVELVVEIAEDTDYAQLTDELYRQLREALGSISQQYELVLLLTVRGTAQAFRPADRELWE